MKPSVLLCMLRGCDTMAEALLERADLEIITIYDAVAQLLAERGIPHRSLGDFLTRGMRQRVLREAEARRRAVDGALQGREMRRGWPRYDDVVWAALSGAVGHTLQRNLAEEMALVDIVRRCMGEVDLRLVLVSDDASRDSKTVIHAARWLGVPSLHVLQGFPHSPAHTEEGRFADRTAVHSELAKERCVNAGVDPGRIVITGNPAWDIYAGRFLPGLLELAFSCRRLDPSRPVATYALTSACRTSATHVTHPLFPVQTAKAVIDTFVALSERHPSWQFVIRPHPANDGCAPELAKYAADAGLRDLCVDTGPEIECLAVTDVFLCTDSNMGIEAILCGKPVINVVIDELCGPLFSEGLGPLFQEDDAVLVVRKTEDLAPVVEAAVGDRDVQQRLLRARPGSIRRFNTSNDGKATDRVCALALDMIENGHRYARPVDRFPEYELALAQATPADAATVLVVGRAAGYTADAIRRVVSQARVHTARTCDEPGLERVEAVVLADPLPHSWVAEKRLRAAAALLSEHGVVVVVFEHGATAEATEAFRSGHWVPPRRYAEAPFKVDQYSRRGVEVVLSRADLEPVGFTGSSDFGERQRLDTGGSDDSGHEPDESDRAVNAWVVCARPRKGGVSPFGEARLERRRRADEMNRNGEAYFTEGRVTDAVSEFAAAINEWNEEALYFNNLGAALYALGQTEQAWRRIREALHLNPNLQAARDNLRMVGQALGRTEEAAQLLALFGEDRSVDAD